MDLRPTGTQQQLIDATAALYAKESTPERVRAAEPLGFDERLWERLGSIGVLSMAVPEADGGWGASLLDLALVAEQHGRHLGSAPLIETQVAARILARAGQPAAATVLREVLEGTRMVTLALTRARHGHVRSVPAGAVASDVVVVSGDDLLLVPVGAGRAAPGNLGDMPLADIEVSGGELLETGPVVAQIWDTAIDEWLSLSAAALAAIALRSVEIGVDYATERHAFGQPIGAFQSIAHGLANAATDADAAHLLARYATWAAEEEPERFPELAALAFGLAAEAARDASYIALHDHGGYGFMLEYDIQLFYRRARAWARVAMSPSRAYQRASRCRYAATLADVAGRRGVAGVC